MPQLTPFRGCKVISFPPSHDINRHALYSRPPSSNYVLYTLEENPNLILPNVMYWKMKSCKSYIH